MADRFLIPIYLPRWIHEPIRSAKRAFIPRANRTIEEKFTGLDLLGDREIEWSYVAARLPEGQGYVFDFGCGYGNLSIHAVQKGHRVLALDLELNTFSWFHPNVDVISGDLLKIDLPEGAFDFVLNSSTVEHVGLAGRYGVDCEETDGDLAAMHKLRRLLKPSGKMLMTVPCGRDATITPWHRVYGSKRLPKLLSGYVIQDERYWVKRSDNRWYPSDRDVALSYEATSHPTKPSLCSYALGCFVLGLQ